MDEYQEHALKKLQAVGKYHFLKNTLQIVVSVAFLSIFLSLSSAFSYYLFPHSFNVYFSTFLFSFFTRTLERKYMFLICNGILAFVAKSSESSCSTSSTNLTQTKPLVTDEMDGDHYDHHLPLVAEAEKPEDTYINEVEEQGELGSESLGKEEESEAPVIVEDIEGEEYKEREKGCLVKQEQQEEVPISISTEELNKKIEEFIRKMKEEISIEAQQQMIASN